MLLSIIIVNYNVKYFVEQCLHSIYRSRGIERTEMEVFVVDNFSKDGSIGYLKKQFSAIDYPFVHLIANKRNVGFGRANNQALARAMGKYILFLNPDTLLTEHTICDALALAEQIEGLGAMGGYMIHTDGRFALESRRGVPSPWVSFCKMTGLTKLFPKSKTFGRYYMQYLPIDRPVEVDILSGAFMLCPRKALNLTGGFDETFFMYGEDIDLSYRLLQRGLHNYYCPTTLLHYKGESTKKNSYRYVHVFYEAMLIFFKKHYGHCNLLFTFPIKLAIILRALIALIYHQRILLRKFLFPHSMVDKQRMLYIGHASDQVRQLAEEYGLDIDYYKADQTTLPEGHHDSRIKTASYLHIVYDLQNFSTEAILGYFEKPTDGKRKVHIGTFNPTRGILLTGSQVYTLG